MRAEVFFFAVSGMIRRLNTLRHIRSRKLRIQLVSVSVCGCICTVYAQTNAGVFISGHEKPGVYLR